MKGCLLPAFVLISICFPGTSQGASQEMLDSLRPLTSISKRFLVTEEFRVSGKDAKYLRIVYGNREYGLFDAAPELRETSLRIRFIPPGYRFPIRFYAMDVRKPGQLRFLRSKGYISPIPDGLLGLRVEVAGRLSTPFFAVDQVINVPGAGLLGPFPVIINRLGEVIWCHFLLDDYPVSPANKPHMVIKLIRPGVLAALMMLETSWFQLIDLSGNVLRKVDMRELPENPILHHDFLYDEKAASLIAIGTKLETQRKDFLWNSENQDISKILFRLFTSVFWPKKYSTNKIYKIDFNRRAVEVLWDADKELSFSHDMDLRGAAPNPVFLAADLGVFRKLYGSGIELDWTHANSISPTRDGGFLFSIRNLNRVIKLDHQFRSTGWSVGESSNNAFRFDRGVVGFSGQHDASETRRGTILLFDNNVPTWASAAAGRRQSRILEIGLDQVGHRAQMIWEGMPESGPYSSLAGSATELPNGNILGSFPVLAADGPSRSYTLLIEFDYKKKKPVGTLRIENEANCIGYRALPMTTLHTEIPFRSFDSQLVERY